MSTTPAPTTPMTGWAAVRHDQAEDARRGHPGHSLGDWARGHGLQDVDRGLPSGYFAAVPSEEQQRFNVCRGTYRDRDVVLWHWRFPLEARGDGHFLGAPVAAGAVVRDRTWWHFLLPGWLAPVRPAFVGLPCTAAAALLPEAALLPPWRITRHDPLLPGRDDLARHGAPGYRLDTRADSLPEGFLETALDAGLREVLAAGADRGVFEVRLDHATLSVRRDGYADEPGCDTLLDLMHRAAVAVASACAPLHRPVPFAHALPAGCWPPRDAPPSGLSPRLQELAAPSSVPSDLGAGVQRLRERFDLTVEDPRAYHAAFPTLPVPGTALAVLRGELPRLPGPVRVVVHTEVHPSVNSGRTALLVPSAGLATTPRGGVRLPHATENVRYAVADDVLCVWVLRHRPGDPGDLDLLRHLTLQLLDPTPAPTTAPTTTAPEVHP